MLNAKALPNSDRDRQAFIRHARMHLRLQNTWWNNLWFGYLSTETNRQIDRTSNTDQCTDTLFFLQIYVPGY